MSDDMDFLDAVSKFGRELLGKNPDLDDLVETARAGIGDPREAVKEVWRAAAQRPEVAQLLESSLFSAFGVEPGSTDIAHFPERGRMLERWGFTDDDLIFEPFPDRPGYKMLHPLLMGMIVELLQFDGDVPEMRTGRLPEGGAPAVPVRMAARSPVSVGAMLRTASQEVALELGAAREQVDRKLAEMVQSSGGAREMTALARAEGEKGIAVAGYGPGRRAEMREVTGPTGGQLAQMPFEERQELAHKALASTQGRRSIVPVIADMVIQALHAEGYTGLRVGDGDVVFSEAEWVVQIDGGQGERNPNFNFVDVAARSLTAKLRRSLAGHASRFTSLKLQVAPVNAVAERRVGWRAVLYE